jgi:hypothetical protein
VLAEKWHEEEARRDATFRDPGVAGVEGARFYHSQSGGCARAVAYASLGVPRSNPTDLAGHFITRQGRMLHDAWQEIFQATFPGAKVEVIVKEGERAGHVDGVVTAVAEAHARGAVVMHDRLVSIEGKSVDGYSYKAALGVPPASRVAQGPKHSHKLQAFLNAKALDADEAVIIYWPRGAISHQAAKRNNISEMTRVVAEWTYTREQYEPEAEREIKRIEGILKLLDGGTLPARIIPDPELPRHHVITNPAKGEWMSFDRDGQLLDAGTTWHCIYCPWQDTCAQTGPQRAPITVLDRLAKVGLGMEDS